MNGHDKNKEDVQRRLRRIEGQIRGLQKMVEDDRYCIDVLTQISSATRALQGVALSLLDDHLRHCVSDAIASRSADADDKLTEATAAVARLLKS
jgi:DNA-binding FrmR family transcriptional regulator